MNLRSSLAACLRSLMLSSKGRNSEIMEESWPVLAVRGRFWPAVTNVVLQNEMMKKIQVRRRLCKNESRKVLGKHVARKGRNTWCSFRRQVILRREARYAAVFNLEARKRRQTFWRYILVLANIRSSHEFLEFLAVLYFRRRVRHICAKKVFLVILLPHLCPQSSRISALEENPIIININKR